jgi:hypothetical protein
MGYSRSTGIVIRNFESLRKHMCPEKSLSADARGEDSLGDGPTDRQTAACTYKLPQKAAQHNHRVQIPLHVAIFATVVLTDPVIKTPGPVMQALRRNKNGPI